MAATPFSQIVNGASQNHSINPPRLPPPAFLACNLINQLKTNSQLLEETSCYPGAVLLHSQQKTSRRSAVLGGVSTSAAAAITLLITQTITPPVSLAIVEKEKETDSNNNGWWLTGPLPVPTVTNSESIYKPIKVTNMGRFGFVFCIWIYASEFYRRACEWRDGNEKLPPKRDLHGECGGRWECFPAEGVRFWSTGVGWFDGERFMELYEEIPMSEIYIYVLGLRQGHLRGFSRKQTISTWSCRQVFRQRWRCKLVNF